MANPTHAAIVLCGGHSRRMGFSKAWLPFGDETMLGRVVRIVRSVVDTVVVVAAADQELPTLPAEVIIVRDAHPDRGPLQGLLAGLSALSPTIDRAFVASCDIPLLSPNFIERMLELADNHEIAVTFDEVGDVAFYHSLAAVYRPTVIPHIEKLLAGPRRSVASLLDLVPTNRLKVPDLVSVDPTGGWVINVNLYSDYEQAAQIAGIQIPEELRQQLLAAQRKELGSNLRR